MQCHNATRRTADTVSIKRAHTEITLTRNRLFPNHSLFVCVCVCVCIYCVCASVVCGNCRAHWSEFTRDLCVLSGVGHLETGMKEKKKTKKKQTRQMKHFCAHLCSVTNPPIRALNSNLRLVLGSEKRGLNSVRSRLSASNFPTVALVAGYNHIGSIWPDIIPSIRSLPSSVSRRWPGRSSAWNINSTTLSEWCGLSSTQGRRHK